MTDCIYLKKSLSSFSVANQFVGEAFRVNLNEFSYGLISGVTYQSVEAFIVWQQHIILTVFFIRISVEFSFGYNTTQIKNVSIISSVFVRHII